MRTDGRIQRQEILGLAVHDQILRNIYPGQTQGDVGTQRDRVSWTYNDLFNLNQPDYLHKERRQYQRFAITQDPSIILIKKAGREGHKISYLLE